MPSRILWVRGGVCGFDGEADAAAGGELGGDGHAVGVASGGEVVEDLVDDELVETGVVAVACEVEFEGFGFDAGGVRDIADLELGEVGLACNGAEGGEVRAIKGNPVVAIGGWVGEGFEDGWVGVGGDGGIGLAEEPEVRDFGVLHRLFIFFIKRI